MPDWGTTGRVCHGMLIGDAEGANVMSDRRLALVVAVDRYDHPALHQLAAPSADADALAEVLGDPELGDFEVDVVHNPTSWETAERVERMLADRRTTDLVLLHFSCHGLKDDSGELYLAATNTRPDLLGSTAVDAAWVNRFMQRSRARSVVLLLDCCYGGAFERGVIARAGGDVDVGDQFGQREIGGGRGRVVITASTAMEYAFEGARLTGDTPAAPSIFTGALVEGIRTGDADRDQDGHVALSELYDYVYDRVREQTPNQTPSKWEFGLRGDLYVARNPHRRVRPAPAVIEPSVPIKPVVPADGRPAKHRALELPPRPVPVLVAQAVVWGYRRLPRPVRAWRPPRPVRAWVHAYVETFGKLWRLPITRRAVQAVAGGYRRLPRSVLVVAAALVVAGPVAVIVMANLSGSYNNYHYTGPVASSSAPSSGVRDYSALLAMLPASVRGTCSPGTRSGGNSATANCSSAEFELWDTTAAMADELGLSGTTAGRCTDVPPAGKRFAAALPRGGRSGKVICDLLNADQGVASRRYCVEWGVDDLLLTGTFYAESGGGTASYRPTYDKAMEVLRQLP